MFEIFRLFKKPVLPQIWTFPRGKIQEIKNTPEAKSYAIFSDDGEKNAFLLLEIENTGFLSSLLLDLALNTFGDINKFWLFYAKYRKLLTRQKPPTDCNKRLTLSWVRQNNKEIAWVIDFRVTLTDRLTILRLFPAIAAYQFVEESDWYLHVVTQDWVKLFIEAIKESDIVALSPFHSNLVAKRIKREKLAEINQRLQLYWKLKGVGESTPTALPNQVRQPPAPRIPYEAISTLVLEKHRNRL